MALRAVTDISIISTSTGVIEIDTLLSNLLLHLELKLEKCDTPFIMSSIPTYIARTLYEHYSDMPYTHKIFNFLDNGKRDNPFSPLKKAFIRLSVDNKNCHLHPLPVAWCYCENFTAIDMSTTIDSDNHEESCDVFSALALSYMYNAKAYLNEKEITTVELVQVKNELGVRINKEFLLMQPSEPLLAILSPAENRLSIEAVTRQLSRRKYVPILNKIKIKTLQNSGTYLATVEFSQNNKINAFRMIPSHALLLASLLGEGQIYVDDKLIVSGAY